MALKIREIANAHDVFTMQAPPLARAVYFTTEVDEEIPGDLYMAVAQVLAYVFQLKSFRKGEGQRPAPYKEADLPEAMRYDARGKSQG